jgi:hypothetical protein
LLLSPSWADRVGRAYIDAANKIISGDPSETRLAVSYLETARQKTRALDEDIARTFRQAGLRVGSAELLRLAVQANANLGMDDSVAAYIALDPAQSQDARITAIERFLTGHPKSAMRPGALLEVARAEVVAGNRPKAKAFAEEASQVATDQPTKDAAQALLQEISAVERSETEAGEEVRRTQLQAQESLARQRLAEQQAQAQATRLAAQATAERTQRETAARAQMARERQRKAELIARALPVLPGMWEFLEPIPHNLYGYIQIDQVTPDGKLYGSFNFTRARSAINSRNRMDGVIDGSEVTLNRYRPKLIMRWSGSIDVDAGIMEGTCENLVQGNETSAGETWAWRAKKK